MLPVHSDIKKRRMLFEGGEKWLNGKAYRSWELLKRMEGVYNYKMATSATLIGDNGKGLDEHEKLYRKDEPDVGRLRWQN